MVLEEYNFVLYKNKYYHFDCYVSSLVNKKRNPLEIGEARRIARELKDQSKDVVNDIIAKNHLYTWLRKKYEIIVMPSYIFTRLESVFKGDYKGMDRSIPAEDLLDMWKRKWSDLNDLYGWNVKKGKSMDSIGRLLYDLAVILAKTTSYYSWKENQKITEQKIKELQLENRNKINYDNINSKVKSKTNNSFELNELIDEV